MRDLQSTKAMWLKAWLFLFIGLLSAGILLVENWSWRTAGLLALGVWGFCRAYYFAFYVIEHYIDPGYSFDGLISAIRHLRKIRKDTIRNGPERS